MKIIILSITAAMLMLVIPATARDYRDISEHALFLTDKMAYELNLTEDQYEAAYEINYDYLYDVFYHSDFYDDDDLDDLYGRAWKLRNRDLKIILLRSQYDAYKRLKYFYRPFHRSHGKIVINIYNYYPKRDYLYFGCPHFVVSYRGGHGWRHYRHHSYYSGRAWNVNINCGMRSGYNKGHRYYHNVNNHRNRHHDVHNGHRYRNECHDGFRNTGHHGRVSSTRTTVNNRSSKSERTRENFDRAQRLPDNKFSPRNNRSNRSEDTRDKFNRTQKVSNKNVSPRNNRSNDSNFRRTVNKSDKRNNKSDNSNNSERKGRFGGGR